VVRRPALARRLGDDLEELDRVQAQLLGQRDGLAGAQHRDAEQHVVADLGRLPRPVVAGPDGRAAHRLQGRLDAGEVGSSQPTMKARVPASAAMVPPETGASAKAEARLLGQGGDGAGAVDVDGRAVDQQGRGRRMGHDLFRIDLRTCGRPAAW
jgi:hypothetical protein